MKNTKTACLNQLDLLDNLNHSRLDLNDGYRDRLTSATVNQTLERLQRIKLVKVVGKTCSCRLTTWKMTWKMKSNFKKWKFLSSGKG